MKKIDEGTMLAHWIFDYSTIGMEKCNIYTCFSTGYFRRVTMSHLKEC